MDIAWAAGLFEGEGCFYLKTKPNRVATAQLATTDKDVLDKFRSIIGFGVVAGPTIRNNYKPYWTWRVGSFEHFQQVVCLFWRHLGNRRRQKALEILKEYLATPLKQVHKRKQFPPRLSPSTLNEIRRHLSLGKCQTDIAKLFGVSPSLISRIHTGDRH